MAVATCLAALVAVGCSDQGAGEGGAGASGIVGSEGPLAWLPADTWLVASADLGSKRIDTAVQTLDRLPIWSLAEGFMPASDGKGLRRELLEELAKSANDSEEADGTVTAKQLEAAFGDRVGVAITSTDFSKFEGETAPIVGWVEVDDADAAEQVVRELATGKVSKQKHDGVEYLTDEGIGAIAIRDELLLYSTSEAGLQRLVDVHEGDGDSIVDDEVGRAVIEAGIGEAIAGVAIQSDPLLAAAPEFVRQGADEAEDPGDAARARQIAEDLGPVLGSDAIDGLVSDWSAASLTIDETGLRSRGAWSNPRELAEPGLGSRELTERMPADAPNVTAGVQDGSGIGRIQDAWREVRDAYDLDLRAYRDECDPAQRAFCDLAIEAAVALLEDEELADAAREAGDSSYAYVQDVAPMLAAAANLSDAAARPVAAKSRIVEFASSSGSRLDWKPSPELVGAAARAGVVVSTTGERSSITFRVRPGSPLARAIARIPARDLAGFALLGIDLRALVSPAGLTIRSEEVDDIRVIGLPQQAPSKVVAALEGEATTIGESESYREVTAAVDVPDEVGAYGYVDLRAYVEAILSAIGTEVPEVRRVMPTVRNNLADVPGVMWWSSREEHDGERVGVFEAVAPILE